MWVVDCGWNFHWKWNFGFVATALDALEVDVDRNDKVDGNVGKKGFVSCLYFHCKGLSRGRFGMEKNKTIKRWMEILWFCWNSIECSNEMHLQLSNCSTSMKINRKCRLLLAEGPFAYKTCFNLNIKGTHSREIPMLRCNVGTNMFNEQCSYCYHRLT